MSFVRMLIEDWLVPGILLVAIFATFRLPTRLRVGARRPAYAGCCAGLVLCLLYLLAASAADTGLAVATAAALGLNWFHGLILGLIGGAAVPRLCKRCVSGRSVGFLCLVLTASASASLVDTFLSPPLRPFTIALTLFGVLGFLLNLTASTTTRQETGMGSR